MIEEQRNIKPKLLSLYIFNILVSGFFICTATNFLLDNTTLITIIDIVLFIAAIVFDIVIIKLLRQKEEIKKPLDAIPRNIYIVNGVVFLVGLSILLFIYYS